jgi:hypothetical protein
MIPFWLHFLSIAAILAGIGSVLVVAADELRDRQQMAIMNAVWPISALWGGPLALAAYLVWGRLSAKGRAAQAGGHGMKAPAGGPFFVMVGKGCAHCGAGCTIGDIIAEWTAFAFPPVAVWFGWHILFTDKTFAVWILDFVLAFLFGIAFQYFSIAPMRGLSVREGIVAALKADALSLAAWQAGMYGFMAIARFWIFSSLIRARLDPAMPEFWFMMQIAMICGFMAAYPVNWWLLRVGIKEKM